MHTWRETLLTPKEIRSSIHVIISFPFLLKSHCLCPVIGAQFGFLPVSMLPDTWDTQHSARVILNTQ